MNTVVLQSNYFPWRGYFDLIRNCDNFIFYDDVLYTKNDWRNRNQVRSNNGQHWITIPISAKAVKSNINEVNLDFDETWRESHLSILKSCYARSPYFKKQLLPFMEHVLFEFKTNNLSELNQYIITLISREAGFKTTFKNSTEFSPKGSKGERLLSLLVQANVRTYLTGNSARSYLAIMKDEFSEAGIELKYYDYPKYKKYGDSESWYMPELSILDFLANEDMKNLLPHLKEANHGFN